MDEMMTTLNHYKVFDSHFHIIDKRFPLVENQGYLPAEFTISDYLKRTENYQIVGGAVVSGSFQAFDQSYLLAALAELGPGFVGVTQLPETVSDEELIRLDRAGVRAVRFNLKRGGSTEVKYLERFSRRVYEIVGWHVEVYVDSQDLPDLTGILIQLPAVCIDHLGLSAEGLPPLLALVEKGVFVKATGFGRVDFPAKDVIQKIIAVNPAALVFGTDLPSTRAPRPYCDDDYFLLVEALGEATARHVFYDNASKLYRLK